MRGVNGAFDFTARGYEVLRVIGTGQFGRAFLVRHRSDGALRTAKMVDLTVLEHGDALKAGQEVDFLHLVRDHPSIVSSYEHFIYQNTYLVIIMEYCQGGDMAHCLMSMKLTQSRFPESEIVIMLRQLLEALLYIHERFILHRDLKPSNILLTGSGHLKIADFGVSRRLSCTLPKARTSVGTPQYMPPEMMLSRSYTYHSDMWSLGCVLYEMVALRPAFQAENSVNLAFKVCFAHPPRFETDYSRPLKDIILRLLAKDPDQRPSPNDILESSYMRACDGIIRIPRPLAQEASYLPEEHVLESHTLTRLSEKDEGSESTTEIPVTTRTLHCPGEEQLVLKTAPFASRASSVNNSPKNDAYITRLANEESELVSSGNVLKADMRSTRTMHRCTKFEVLEVRYCEIIIRRIELGLEKAGLPCVAAMLMTHESWDSLLAQARELTAAMCGGDASASKRLVDGQESCYESILLDIISRHVHIEVTAACSDDWLPSPPGYLGTTPVDGVLDDGVTPEWLGRTSNRFGLGLSRAECELLLQWMINVTHRTTVALRGFIHLTTVGIISSLCGGLDDDQLAKPSEIAISETRRRFNNIFVSASDILGGEQQVLIEGALRRVLPQLDDSSPVDARVFRDILSQHSGARSSEIHTICQMAHKDHQGNILWKSTLRDLASTIDSRADDDVKRRQSLLLHSSSESQPRVLGDKPQKTSAERLFAQDVILKSERRQLAGPSRTISNASNTSMAPVDSPQGFSPALVQKSPTLCQRSPISLSRLSTSPGDILQVKVTLHSDDTIGRAVSYPRKSKMQRGLKAATRKQSRLRSPRSPVANMLVESNSLLVTSAADNNDSPKSTVTTSAVDYMHRDGAANIFYPEEPVVSIYQHSRPVVKSRADLITKKALRRLTSRECSIIPPFTSNSPPSQRGPVVMLFREGRFPPAFVSEVDIEEPAIVRQPLIVRQSDPSKSNLIRELENNVYHSNPDSLMTIMIECILGNERVIEMLICEHEEVRQINPHAFLMRGSFDVLNDLRQPIDDAVRILSDVSKRWRTLGLRPGNTGIGRVLSGLKDISEQIRRSLSSVSANGMLKVLGRLSYCVADTLTDLEGIFSPKASKAGSLQSAQSILDAIQAITITFAAQLSCHTEALIVILPAEANSTDVEDMLVCAKDRTITLERCEEILNRQGGTSHCISLDDHEALLEPTDLIKGWCRSTLRESMNRNFEVPADFTTVPGQYAALQCPLSNKSTVPNVNPGFIRPVNGAGHAVTNSFRKKTDLSAKKERIPSSNELVRLPLVDGPPIYSSRGEDGSRLLYMTTSSLEELATSATTWERDRRSGLDSRVTVACLAPSKSTLDSRLEKRMLPNTMDTAGSIVFDGRLYSRIDGHARGMDGLIGRAFDHGVRVPKSSDGRCMDKTRVYDAGIRGFDAAHHAGRICYDDRCGALDGGRQDTASSLRGKEATRIERVLDRENRIAGILDGRVGNGVDSRIDNGTAITVDSRMSVDNRFGGCLQDKNRFHETRIDFVDNCRLVKGGMEGRGGVQQQQYDDRCVDSEDIRGNTSSDYRVYRQRIHTTKSNQTVGYDVPRRYTAKEYSISSSSTSTSSSSSVAAPCAPVNGRFCYDDEEGDGDIYAKPFGLRKYKDCPFKMSSPKNNS